VPRLAVVSPATTVSTSSSIHSSFLNWCQ
jgi:hypothetical protein